jgi:adenylate cyclase
VGRVFLSYAREDVESAKSLAEAISAVGHDVWWDRHLHGGSRFVAEIDRELKEADAVVVVWSETSVESAWVQDEAAEGRDSGRLVPVALGAVKPPLGFRQFHTIALGSWNGSGAPEAIAELIDAISRTCGNERAAEKAPGPETARTKAKASICVLPFANMSGEPEQEYFSDGISEDIITDLSKVSALSIVARNTAFTFKGQSLDVKDVARTLGVSHVLEGSVRKAGNRVRITAQLIDGVAGDHVWADRYDRDLDDIFAIQDEISKAIVDALKIKLLPQEKKAIEHRGTSNIDAYNLYLLARHQWVTGNYGDQRLEDTIVRLCTQATQLDPDYAQAWALMALAQSELRFVFGSDVNALPAADRALELDAALPEAHCIKARYLEEEGRADEAEEQIRTALKLDPESWEVNREAARMLFRRGRTSDAAHFFKKAASLVDSDWHNALMLITCYSASDDKAELRAAATMTKERAERAIAKDPANGQALAAGANALFILGDLDRAHEWSRRALLLDPDNLIMCYNLGCTFARFGGAVDDAISALQPFFEGAKTAQNIRHLEADPDLDPIRDEPRFKKMLAAARKRLGMSEIAEVPPPTAAA